MTSAAAPAPDARDGRRRLPPDERRELIVASAAKLFEARPYAQVSTVEIAREAGIARGLLNHYFGDKRGLFLEVVRRAVLLPELEELPTPPASGRPDGRVDAAVAWFLDSAQKHATSYFTVIGSEGVADDPEVAAILAEADDLAARRVLQLLGLPEDDDLARALVRCYGGLAKATLQEWGRRGTLTREQAHGLLRDVLLFMTDGVLARGAGT